MRILLLDVETAPNTAYVWGLFKENIPLARLMETGYVMCWSAKWYGSDKIEFCSTQQNTTIYMLDKIHQLLDEADVVIHFYGRRFDIPMLNREFLQHNFKPPSPYKQIDLCLVCKNTFKFVSNKMEHVAEFLGLKPKEKHEGFELWVKCMQGDPEAWKEMERYNKGDVETLEEIYDAMKPWISNHPNHNLYSNGEHVCPNCGGTHLQRRGFYPLTAGVYQRYRCNDCGKWSRDTNKIKESVKVRGAV